MEEDEASSSCEGKKLVGSLPGAGPLSTSFALSRTCRLDAASDQRFLLSSVYR